MAHDPYYLDDLPAPVRYQAEAMLARTLEDVDRCGESRSFGGFALESHTLGCRREAGDADPWEAHWRIFDDYAGDGFSRIMGDPGDGAFVTVNREERERTVFLDGLEPPDAGDYAMGQVRKKVRVPHAKAERIAEKLLRDIKPLAEFALIAGSVRRRTLEVADIEIVVLPKDLGKFVRTVEDMGFVEGGDRIRRGAAGGLKAELYIAHRPKELGAMVLMYTGDYIFNMAMRGKALRMGFHLDQYGLYTETKKGKRYVFQSEEEGDFFDKLHMEWHEPEQRSLAWRSQMQKMARELLGLDIPKAEKTFLQDALDVIRKEKYLDLDGQARLDRLYKKRLPQATGLAGPYSLGAEELIELGARPDPKGWSPRGEHPVDLTEWQAHYEAQGGTGTVHRVFAKMDMDSLRLWVEAVEDGRAVFFIPLFHDAPAEDELAYWGARPTEWIHGVAEEALSVNGGALHGRPF